MSLRPLLFVDCDISRVKFVQILIVDLTQVDPMNFRVECREAAERVTKSWEVDLSCLVGFHLYFAPKMRSGVTCNWCLRWHLKVNGWRKESVPLRLTKTIMCVHFSCVEIEIHQSQPLVWPSDLLYVMLAGCDWWISIRSVDNMYDWRKFWKRFCGCFVFESRVSTKMVVNVAVHAQVCRLFCLGYMPFFGLIQARPCFQSSMWISSVTGISKILCTSEVASATCAHMRM